MPINYLTIKRQSALVLAQMIGTDQATLEAAYSGAWATALDGAEIPASAFKDLILMIEKELAQGIGLNAQHPARTFLYGRSANLIDLDSTPAVDNRGYEFVGIFDSCSDSATSAPLTFQPRETLADLRESFFDDVELYNYNITGNTISHTRPTAYLQGCVWDYTTQAALYNTDGDSPLPQAFANTWINGIVANAPQVGWTDGAGVAGYYAQLYAQGLQELGLGAGMPNIPIASQNTAAG